MSRLSFGDALRDGIWIDQVMGVIREDDKFHYDEVAIKVVEKVKQEEFALYYSHDITDKKMKTWIHFKNVIAHSKQEAADIRLMKRDPKRVYAYKVRYRDNESYTEKIYYKYALNGRLAVLEMKMRICEDFFEFHNLTTADMVTEFMKNRMIQSDNLHNFKVELGIIKPVPTRVTCKDKKNTRRKKK